MKIKIALLSLLCLLTAGICKAQTLATTPSGKNPMKFEVSGDTLTVKLEGNNTTGYTWDYTIKKTKVLNLKNSQYIQSQGVKFISGSGGIQQYVFYGLKAGKTKVTFDYARRFKDKKPESVGVRILEVTVNSDKSLSVKEID